MVLFVLFVYWVPFDENAGLPLPVRTHKITISSTKVNQERGFACIGLRIHNLHGWAARGHRTEGHLGVAVKWERSNDEFRHFSLAYVEDVLILSNEIVGIVGVG